MIMTEFSRATRGGGEAAGERAGGAEGTAEAQKERRAVQEGRWTEVRGAAGLTHRGKCALIGVRGPDQLL